MRVRIHRGAHEIGGSCVEVEAAGCRLVLDVGRPLNAPRDASVPLPDVAGFGGGDPSLAGVVISHAHQDHWGLVDQVAAGVPIYLGEATRRILAEAEFWSSGIDVDAAGFLDHRTPLDIGPFRVTPFLNDHSAFDAYSLLVEAEGKRLFYTGDIRGHGRKAAIFEELLRKPPRASTSCSWRAPTSVPATSRRCAGDARAGGDRNGRGSGLRRHLPGHRRPGPRRLLRPEHRPPRHPLPGDAAGRPGLRHGSLHRRRGPGHRATPTSPSPARTGRGSTSTSRCGSAAGSRTRAPSTGSRRSSPTGSSKRTWPLTRPVSWPPSPSPTAPVSPPPGR